MLSDVDKMRLKTVKLKEKKKLQTNKSATLRQFCSNNMSVNSLSWMAGLCFQAARAQDSDKVRGDLF